MSKKPPALSGNLKITGPNPKAGDGMTVEKMAQIIGVDGMRLIVGVVHRAEKIVAHHRATMLGPDDQTLEPNREILMADLMVCHYWRKLNLSALLTCNDLDFLSEIATVARFIQRPIVFFPGDVKLRFAQSGASFFN
jgi:hypothetical protein